MISTKPGLNRYLRTTPGGPLRIDAARIKAEENLDRYINCGTPATRQPGQLTNRLLRQPEHLTVPADGVCRSAAQPTRYRATASVSHARPLPGRSVGVA